MCIKWIILMLSYPLIKIHVHFRFYLLYMPCYLIVTNFFLTCNCTFIRSYYLTSHEIKINRVMDPNSFTHCIRIYNHHHLIYYNIKIQNQIHKQLHTFYKKTDQMLYYSIIFIVFVHDEFITFP